MRRYLGYKVLAASFGTSQWRYDGDSRFWVLSPCFVSWESSPVWMNGGDSYIGVHDVRADCKRMVVHQTIPDERCTCGLYISTKWDKFLEWVKHNAITRAIRNNQFLLFTVVEASGTLIEHDDGFRAEKARVIRLIDAQELVYSWDKSLIFKNTRSVDYISDLSGLPIIQDYEARDLIEGKAYPLFSLPYQKGDTP